MSQNGDQEIDEEEPGFEEYDSERVLDEEGTVDQKIKDRILDSRAAINENENVLFTQRAMMPDVQINRAQAIVAWGHCIRRYVRDVEVLLDNDNIPESEKYYKEVEMGEVTVAPPDTDGYQFSKFANDGVDDDVLKKQMGLPHDASVPKPYTEKFIGLEDIIESDDMVSRTWNVYVNKTGPVSEWEQITLEARAPIKKKIYERAVRFTDKFLQNAGIGINTGTPEVYDESEPW